jgi:hypothetical protein
MTDLVEFLRARLDEDYEAARLVLGANAMAAYKRGEPVPRWVPSPEGDAGIWDTNGTPRVKFVWARERDHIIRHDPARVLAEVEAKRRILDDVLPTMQADEVSIAGEWGVGSEPVREASDDLLSLLALPYVSHPDYREEWKP